MGSCKENGTESHLAWRWHGRGKIIEMESCCADDDDGRGRGRACRRS